MNGQTTTPPQGGITFWHIVGGGIFVFILLILLPSWVVVIVAGIPLAMGLAGLLNQWFGADGPTTRRIVIIAAVLFVSSVAWNFGERQYPWVFENIKIHGMWRSFQATQAIDPQQPLGLHKSVYDTRRDRITHKQQAWATVLQGLRHGANPNSALLENQLRSARLMNDISAAAKEKIAATTLTAEDIIQEAEAQRIILQQQLEKIRLTPPPNAATKPWLQSIQAGPLWAKLFWPGLILAGIGVILWFLPPVKKWGGRLVFLGGLLALLGGAAAVADIKSADQVPGLRPAPRTAATTYAPTGGVREIRVALQPGVWSAPVHEPPGAHKYFFRGPRGTRVKFADGVEGSVTGNFKSPAPLRFFHPTSAGEVVVVFKSL